ncbi:MAG: head maturation protease, ClpP-related [Mycobacterium sp.]
MNTLDTEIGTLAEESAKRLRDMGARTFKSSKADSEPRGPWFTVKDLADDDTTAQIDIYDEIDWLWGVTSRDFRDQLKALPESVNTIDLHINSPGGDVYEALAIMNTLRQHKAKVVTTIDGYAASSAGFIAVGASDELVVSENAEIMAHLPWAVMIGDADEMRKMAEDLDRIGKNIASIFQARAGGKLDDWVAILTAETWWSADEAVAAGIADKVLKTPKRDAKNSARDRFNLSVFNHAGRSNAPAPQIPQAHNETPQPVEAEAPKEKEPTVALSESALTKLGLDAEADEDAINEAIEKITAPEPAGEPTIEEAAKVAAKFGQKLVNAAGYDQLAASVANLEARRDEAIKAENESAITSALSSGRIDAASADTWRNELTKNREGTLALLATLPANKAVPVDEIGHGVTREDNAMDAELGTVFARITGTTFGKDA